MISRVEKQGVGRPRKRPTLRILPSENRRLLTREGLGLLRTRTPVLPNT